MIPNAQSNLLNPSDIDEKSPDSKIETSSNKSKKTQKKTTKVNPCYESNGPWPRVFEFPCDSLAPKLLKSLKKQRNVDCYCALIDALSNKMIGLEM